MNGLRIFRVRYDLRLNTHVRNLTLRFCRALLPRPSDEELGLGCLCKQISPLHASSSP